MRLCAQVYGNSTRPTEQANRGEFIQLERLYFNKVIPCLRMPSVNLALTVFSLSRLSNNPAFVLHFKKLASPI